MSAPACTALLLPSLHEQHPGVPAEICIQLPQDNTWISTISGGSRHSSPPPVFELLPNLPAVFAIVGDQFQPWAPFAQLPLPVLQQARRHYYQVRTTILIQSLSDACIQARCGSGKYNKDVTIGPSTFCAAPAEKLSSRLAGTMTRSPTIRDS